MDVDAGVDLWLLIQQREGQRHRVLDAIAAPDAWAEATVALDQNELLLFGAGRR